MTVAATSALTVGGSFTQTATGGLIVGISSAGNGFVDASATDASLDGRLLVSPDPGFVPAPEATFAVVRFGTRTGSFGSVLGTPAGAGNTYVLQYDPAAADLVVRPTTMSFVPIAGQPGTQFTMTGDGFSPGEAVGVTMKNIQLQPAVADGAGHFVVVETVPTLTVGAYPVKARGATSFVSVTRNFTVVRKINNEQFRLIGQQLLLTDPLAESPTTTNADEAIDPHNPDHLVAVYQEGQYADGAALDTGFASSSNDGYSWNTGIMPGLTVPVGGPYRRAGNPRVAFGMDGAAFAVSQVLDSVKCKSALAVNRSEDWGRSWDVATFPFTMTSCDGQVDMTGVAVDTNPSSPFFGRIYLVWDTAHSTGGQPVSLISSTDGGATWTAPVQITPTGMDAVAPTPLVQPDGALTIYYAQPTSLMETVQTSSDGGVTFGAPVEVHSYDAVDPPDILAGNDQGIGDAAVDPATGYLYVVWPDRRYDKWGLNAMVMSKSTDGGATWDGPLLLSGATDAPVDRFTPALDVSGGYVAVTWYHWSIWESGGVRLNRGFTFSSNDGQTWSKTMVIGCGQKPLEIDLDQAAVVEGKYFFGHYQGMVTTPLEAHPVWTVASTAESGYNQGAWTATLRYVHERRGDRLETDPTC
jgi:hypothetical protein